MRRHTESLFESLAEVRPGKAGRLCHVFHAERLGVPGVRQIPGSEQLP